MVFKNAPAAYQKEVNEIKYKRLKRILNFDLANTALDIGRGYLYNKLE